MGDDPLPLTPDEFFRGRDESQRIFEALRDAVAAGGPQSELLEDYPGVEPEFIRGALRYAAELVEVERVYPVAMTA